MLMLLLMFGSSWQSECRTGPETSDAEPEGSGHGNHSLLPCDLAGQAVCPSMSLKSDAMSCLWLYSKCTLLISANETINSARKTFALQN